MKKKKPYWAFFKCGLFQSNKQRGHPLYQNRVRLLMMGLLIVVLNSLFSTACKNDTSSQLGISSNVTSKEFVTTTTLKVEKPMGSFIAQDPSISTFRQMMNDIYSLKTLTKIKSKQLILFVPEDAAFEKLGKEEKEKLLDPATITHRHELFKNSLILHDKKNGEWTGQGVTYDENPINVNFQTGIVSFQQHQARILKQVKLKNGHLVYIIDAVIS